MDASLKIVTRLPLGELWRDDGFSTDSRGRTLTLEDVRQFLETGSVQFVVVDVGAAPRWIPASECFRFWKNEVKPHLASAAKAPLDEFPGGYCYFASRWEEREGEAPIVVLEKEH